MSLTIAFFQKQLQDVIEKNIQFYYAPTQLSFLKHTHPILRPAPVIGGNGDIEEGVQELDAYVV